MPRSKAFDPDGAIATATEVFWQQGYHTTSLAQLESRLNIGRKSLYDTFGDKRGLFLRCLDRYTHTPYPISRPDAGWAEIRSMFESPPFFDGDRPGCLLANTTLEFGVQTDPEVAARIRDHVARLERCFAAALSRAQAAGDVPESLDPRAGARYLAVSLQGLAVMAKSGATRSSVKPAIAMILQTLGASP